MKLSFSIRPASSSLEADIEGLVEKGLEHKAKNTAKKTRHQIKQEEKRKNEELKSLGSYLMKWNFRVGGMGK